MILGGEVLTNGITLCLLVIRGIHQGFFVRPFPPSPSQPPSSSSSSLLFNKRFRIETLLGSHLRPLPPPPLFRRQERGLERGGVARYLLAGGRGRHEWLESKAAVLKVSHLFHWPGFEAALYATGSTLSSRLGNSRGRVIPPRETRVTATRDHDWYSFIMAAPVFQAAKSVFCYREEGCVTMRTIVYPRDISRVGDFCLD